MASTTPRPGQGEKSRQLKRRKQERHRRLTDEDEIVSASAGEGRVSAEERAKENCSAKYDSLPRLKNGNGEKMVQCLPSSENVNPRLTTALSAMGET